MVGERQSIAQKGVRAIDARNLQLENGSNATKTSVRAPGLSPDEREHPFVWYFGKQIRHGKELEMMKRLTLARLHILAHWARAVTRCTQKPNKDGPWETVLEMWFWGGATVGTS